jgi:hypothetical protein
MNLTKSSFDISDVLGAFREAAEPPPYGIEAFHRWSEVVLEAFCSAFGVRFDSGSVSESKRPLLERLQEVLRYRARLPHPTRGYADDSLINARYPAEMSALAAAARSLCAHYDGIAATLAREVWGNLGARTQADIRAAGLDPSLAPRIDDYLDEI